MQTGSLELVWTSIAGAGVLISINEARHVLQELRLVPAPGNGRLILGKALLRLESIRGLIQGIWFLFGFSLIMDQHNTIENLGFPLLLIVTNLLTVLSTWINVRARMFI